jgi:four helix bundle protein
MKDYRALNVWKNSHAMTLKIYRLSKSFLRDEIFALTSQLRRAAASIPANLAEGCGPEGDAELKRFANIALGSACELDYHLFLATELGYVDEAESAPLADEILLLRRMLGSFIQKLKS